MAVFQWTFIYRNRWQARFVPQATVYPHLIWSNIRFLKDERAPWIFVLVTAVNCYSFLHDSRESFLSVSVPCLVLSHMTLLSQMTCLANEISANMMQAEARKRLVYALCLLFYHNMEKHGLAPWRMGEHAESVLSLPSHGPNTRLSLAKHMVVQS